MLGRYSWWQLPERKLPFGTHLRPCGRTNVQVTDTWLVDRVATYVNTKVAMIPHYWTPKQVQRLLDSLADLDKRGARTASLIMWRTGLRIGEALSLRVARYRSGGPDSVGRRVEDRFGPDCTSPWRSGAAFRQLASAAWAAGPGAEPQSPDGAPAYPGGDGGRRVDEESPGTGLQKAGAHSLRHSAARHWLTTSGVPLNVVSQWLGHASCKRLRYIGPCGRIDRLTCGG